VWYENAYNTKLLHRNLAFPLLRRLTEVGDSLAKRVFTEEIAKRLESGSPSVVRFLIEEKYFHYAINYIILKHPFYGLIEGLKGF